MDHANGNNTVYGILNPTNARTTTTTTTTAAVAAAATTTAATTMTAGGLMPAIAAPGVFGSIDDGASLNPFVVLSSFPKVYNELIDVFGAPKELANRLTPSVAKVLDGVSIMEFLQRKEAMMKSVKRPDNLIAASKVFIEDIAPLIFYVVPGNVRYAMATFRRNTEHEGSFRLLADNQPLVREMEQLILYTFGQCKAVRGIGDVNQWHLIPQYLFQLAKEEAVSDFFGSPTILQYTIWRMFKTAVDESSSKKNKQSRGMNGGDYDGDGDDGDYDDDGNEDDGGEDTGPKLRQKYALSTMVARMLHLARLGSICVCGLIVDYNGKKLQRQLEICDAV